MAAEISDLYERLHRPEYTGDNRCLPCTIANVLIAALVAAAAAAAVWRYVGPRAALLAGGLVWGPCVLAIYLRGYLVPGTPSLTETYFPDWLLRRFEKQPTAPSEPPTSDSGEQVDAVALLRRVDAVTPCEHEDDVCLTDGFRSAWWGRIDRRQRGTEGCEEGARREDEDREELAVHLGVEADQLSFDEHGDAFVAFFEGDLIGRWESHAAFVADVAAAKELRSRGRGWSALDARRRSAILQRLRAFLTACPACEGPLEVGNETVESCCRTTDVLAIECDDCGARLFEARQPSE